MLPAESSTRIMWQPTVSPPGGKERLHYKPSFHSSRFNENVEIADGKSVSVNVTSLVIVFAEPGIKVKCVKCISMCVYVYTHIEIYIYI